MNKEERRLFKEFCKDAKYYREFPDKPYMVHANGKLLCANDTHDLFEQYKKEIQCQVIIP